MELSHQIFNRTVKSYRIEFYGRTKWDKDEAEIKWRRDFTYPLHPTHEENFKNLKKLRKKAMYEKTGIEYRLVVIEDKITTNRTEFLSE